MKKDNSGDLSGMEGGFTNSSPLHPYCPYEMLYGRPFVYANDFFLDPEAQTLWSYPMDIGQFQHNIYAYAVSTRTQNILKSHHYMVQGLEF